MSQVPFFMHDLGHEELESIAEVFKGPILTTGDTVALFEKRFAEYLGVKHVSTVSSCTAGMHLSLMALGIGPGDEVITTPMTFVATLQAICFTGARPVLVDVEPDTGNIDISRIEGAITPRTKAILPVHLYGLMVDMTGLRRLAGKHGLPVVEDAAHCIEGSRDSLRAGAASQAACFSFFATKNITCGEGGAVATNDRAFNDRIRLLRNHAMSKTSADRFKEGYQHWDVTDLGWKYNMGNIEAAILLPQLARIQEKLSKRQRLASRYAEKFEDLRPLVRIPATRENTVHSRHLFTVWVPADRRDSVVRHLQGRGVPCVVNYRAVHLLSWFRDHLGYAPGSLPNAEAIGNETISLPLYPSMPEEHVDRVVSALREAIKR